MARVRITEFRAKSLLFKELGLPYHGISITSDVKKETETFSNKKYVLKVDDGIKGRMKKGLVKIDLTGKEILKSLKGLKKQGYKRFLIEEFIPHQGAQEKFISIERTRDGLQVFYSASGGIDIEQNQKQVKCDILDIKSAKKIANFLDIPAEFLEKIANICNKYHFSFLEINPFVITKGKIYILDLAVEVDTAGQFFIQEAWTENDFAQSRNREQARQEREIEILASQSQASFKLDVLNPNGSIFMLLSGGGASLVLADEVYNLGFGESLANYGEYSGNPNAEETYIYTKAIISLLKKSNAAKKVLIIGGGVANFTDIRITFGGVIRALEENKKELQKQNLKVFVRRGGPHQDEALQSIEQFLREGNIYGFVTGPNLPLTEIIQKALSVLK